MNTITVIVADPGEEIIRKTIPNTLEAFQSLVGGFIEPISLPDGRVLIVNEEGILYGLPLNRLIQFDGRTLALNGSIVLCRQYLDRFDSIHGGDLAWMQYHSTPVDSPVMV